MLDPGQLWPLVQRRHAEALATGALHAIPTDVVRIEDGGVRFVVRVLAHLEAKARLAGKEHADARADNPFLPYEQALFIADVAPRHVCLFNKFNVVAHHLLLITRAFEHQEALLTAADFAALAFCMREFDALGFYNGGTAAGASQLHKHLQLTPLPLAPGVERDIMAPLLGDTDARRGVREIDALPFRHALRHLRDPDFAPADDGRRLHRCYRRLLDHVHIVDAGGGRQSAPYNLLLTRERMLLVPRARERCEGISVNALGFAGSLFVRDERELDTLRARSPLRLLEAVTLPR